MSVTFLVNGANVLNQQVRGGHRCVASKNDSTACMDSGTARDIIWFTETTALRSYLDLKSLVHIKFKEKSFGWNTKIMERLKMQANEL